MLENKKKLVAPELIGKMVGSPAFSAGDLVVIRTKENALAKVCCRNSDDTVRIVLVGDEQEKDSAESNYLASELGYPSNPELWSQHQQKRYQRCCLEQRNKFVNKIIIVATIVVTALTVILVKEFELLSAEVFLASTRKVVGVTAFVCLGLGLKDISYYGIEIREAVAPSMYALAVYCLLNLIPAINN